jgi:hemerythrin-like domain-containing protein
MFPARRLAAGAELFRIRIAEEGELPMHESQEITRRAFIATTATAAGGLLLSGCTGAVALGESSKARQTATGPEEEQVSPAEDLMREHGVLRRILLVYAEAGRRLDARKDLPLKPLADATRIIRTFIEDYHEKLEEDYLFPRFRKADTLVELVDVLLRQHKAGRRLTDTTQRLAGAGALSRDEDRRGLGHCLGQFIRMYSPHAAREDTVLFPAFRKIVTPQEYDKLGEDFEDREHELFGEKGFEGVVDRVATIEKALGIYDLAQFTPEA